MTKKLGSILVRIAKVLHPSNRGRNLERHADLAHQFALVAPLESFRFLLNRRGIPKSVGI